MRAAWLIALCVLAGCKDKSKPAAPPQPAQPGAESGPPPAPAPTFTVSPECTAAVAKLYTTPLDARPQLLIDSCHVCNNEDWTPMLRWDVDAGSGGPRPEAIEKVMVACGAFCTGDAKMKFMAGVDKARGHGVNVPWRQLADACKDKVDASPDPRFMSATYFALDRIGRAVATYKDGELAVRLAAAPLPLPPLTVTGTGVELPQAAGVSSTTAGWHLTVLADQIYIGMLPRATLRPDGIDVTYGVDHPAYPGELVPLGKVAARLHELLDTGDAVSIIAPRGMKAQTLVDIVAALGDIGVYLAASAPESRDDWMLVGNLPIALETGKDIAITADMTVQQLAQEVAARVAKKQTHVGIMKK